VYNILDPHCRQKPTVVVLPTATAASCVRHGIQPKLVLPAL